MKSTILGAVAALAAALAIPWTASAAEGDAMSMFDQLDTSKDSSIDMDEASRSAQVAADFRHIDSDGNGAISREEWRAYFASTGARPSKTPRRGPDGVAAVIESAAQAVRDAARPAGFVLRLAARVP